MSSKKEKNNQIALYLSNFGRYICLIFVSLAVRLGKGLSAVWKVFSRRLKYVGGWVLKKLKYVAVVLLSPFLRIVHAFGRAFDDIKDNRAEKGLGAALKIAAGHMISFLFGKTGIAVTAFNIIAPALCLLFLFNIVSYASSLTYCVKLTVNDKFLGYVENEQVFYDADEVLKQRINYLGSDETITLTPSFVIELSGNSNLLSKYQVADKILEYSDINVEYAYGFYMNGVFQGAVPDNEPVNRALENILDKYRERYPNAAIEFKDTMDCSTAGLYLSGSIIDTDWLLSQLTSVKTKAGYYIAEDGDTQGSICEKFGLTEFQFSHMNPGYENVALYEGDRIKIREEIPFLSVNVSVIEEYDVTVPYETEYYNDAGMYSGVQRLTTVGEDGINHLTAKVTYVNNIEVSRRVTATSVTLAPVTERIALGTKPTPEQKYSPEDAGYGKFIWPTEGGYISEYGYWNGGYSGHCGIDIVSHGYGSPIFAGASGTVTFAGADRSGYGNYIIIDHGNGYQTLYGHCSALYVTVGQKVTQGEYIAAMGETGMAYGVHLHFEVRQGNQKFNPVNFLEHIPTRY